MHARLARAAEAGLLAQFPVCRVRQVLVWVDETTGQGQASGERFRTAFDEQDVQAAGGWTSVRARGIPAA